MNVICALVFLVLMGCNKRSEFLHHYVRPEEPKHQSIHRLTELQGDRDVDILWVIDNSGSMGDKQQVVIKNTADFASELSRTSVLQWQMGLISTDVSEEAYIDFKKPVTYKDANAVADFQAAVNRLGTMGDGYEKPVDSLKRHFSEQVNYIRPKAWLAVVMISDAPDQSEAKVSEVLRVMETARGGLNKVLFYGVVWPTELCAKPSGENLFSLGGSAFEIFLKGVKGGAIYPLCDPLFGKYLLQMSKDIVARVEHPSIMLKSRPIVNTVEVIHMGVPIPGGTKEMGGYWLYNFDINSIVFHDLSFAKSDTESVEVVYKEDLGID